MTTAAPARAPSRPAGARGFVHSDTDLRMLGGLERKHILLVDDEITTQRLVARALQRDAPQALVRCASNGVEALQMLGRDPVDLLITAMVMPVLDGVELLHHAAKRGLAIPVIVVGGHAAAAGELPPRPGVIQYLPDPVDVDELVRCTRALLVAPEPPPDCAIGLLDLVHLVSRARRTCTLRVTQGHQHGALNFTGGALVDAQLGELHGTPAALEILAWTATSVRYDPFLRARATTIQTSVARLLQELRGSSEPATPPVPPAPANAAGVTVPRASTTTEARAVLPIEARPATRPPAIPMPSKRPNSVPTPATPMAPASQASQASTVHSAPPPSPSSSAASQSCELWEGPDAGPKIARILADAMAIEGAVGATLAVWELDHSLGAVGPRGAELERSGGCRVMRALLTTMTRLDMRANVQDVLITLDHELHILAPLAHHGDLSLAVAIDGARSNLALARHRVQKLVREPLF